MKPRGLVVVVTGLLLMGAPHALAGSAPVLSTIELSAAIEERAAFGLSTDSGLVEGIVRAGEDIGTETWGMVLTAAELEQLDLDGRVEFQNAAADLIAYAESLPPLAGVYYDQKRGGELVLRFTALSDAEAKAIQELMPKQSRGGGRPRRCAGDPC